MGRFWIIFATPNISPQTPVKVRSWDMKTECKKLSLAACAYCMHACLAIRQSLSKEAREASGV